MNVVSICVRLKSEPPKSIGELIEFKCGDEVTKEGGDYKFQGIIVCTFTKLANEAPRVVVQNCDGILHIFNPTQLKKV
jgi:hypothetical protein